MGVKRPFDEETIQELSFKQAKQVDGNNKATSILKDTSCDEASGEAAISGEVEVMGLETELGGDFADDKAEKDFKTSAALSWVTSSSSEGEAGNDGACYLPFNPDFEETNFSRRPPIQYEDAYLYMLNDTPRKEVPVGPNHQADIPEWNPDANRKEPFCSNHIPEYDNEQKLVGLCIIPMPDSIVSSSDDAKVGCGRTDCDCTDKGSLRCVRKHVEEAREKLRARMGEEKFADLGFLEMGEEVALTWTEEEERIFHEVIYCNPVSLGKNFWKHLSSVFPSRTKMELISYYFNVFILRRRAVQNRSHFLDIDSDDDEWQGDGRHCEFGGQDDDSVVESFTDEDHQVPELGISYDPNGENEDKDDKEDNDNDDDGDGDGDGDGNVGVDGQDSSGKGNQEEQMQAEPIDKSREDSGFDTRVNNNMAKVLSSNSKDHDSHASIYFERHPFSVICGPGGEDATIRDNGCKSEHLRFLGGKLNGTSETYGSGFILEGCDTKAWDDPFSTSRLKSIDLLPTCNMIEEIFGPCSWKSN